MNHKIPAVLFSVLLLFANTNIGLSQVTNPNVVAWGPDYQGECRVPVWLTNAVEVVAGDQNSAAVTADGGRLVGWGSGCLVPMGRSNLAHVSISPCNGLGLMCDGTVIAWGIPGTTMDYGQNNVPIGLSNVVAVAAGLFHSLALKEDGTVVAWGRNDFGQCNAPTNLVEVIAISGGYFHSMALKRDGTVVAWGHQGSWNPVPPEATNVIKIIAADYRCLALRADGRVIAWWGRGPLDQPCRVPVSLSGVVDISGGPFEDIALKADGTIVSWGYNGTYTLSFPNVRGISAGEYHCLALLSLDGRRVPARLSINPDGVITIYGGAGLTYRLESSAKLSGLWTPIGYVTITDQTQTFAVGIANNIARFYRAVQVP